jgi:putative transposase
VAREKWLEGHGVNAQWEHGDSRRWNAAYFAIPTPERLDFEHETHKQFFIELDKCHGSCLLQEHHGLVATALEFFHRQRVWTGDYVVMPNHVHALVQPFPVVVLEEWSYSVKRFTSTRMVRDASTGTDQMMRSGHVWQTESFDRVVRDLDELARTRRYIANNPAKLQAGTVALKQMEWLDQIVGRV